MDKVMEKIKLSDTPNNSFLREYNSQLTLGDLFLIFNKLEYYKCWFNKTLNISYISNFNESKKWITTPEMALKVITPENAYEHFNLNILFKNNFLDTLLENNKVDEIKEIFKNSYDKKFIYKIVDNNFELAEELTVIYNKEKPFDFKDIKKLEKLKKEKVKMDLKYDQLEKDVKDIEKAVFPNKIFLEDKEIFGDVLYKRLNYYANPQKRILSPKKINNKFVDVFFTFLIIFLIFYILRIFIK